jgi:NADPH-dependent ferric siderophore reductase
MTRVTVTGAELEGFALRGPAGHIKVFFPKAGEERPVMPEWGPEGPVLLPGQERPTSRTYTPRRWDAATGELDIDFLLHGAGPGAIWAQHARPGDQVVVAGPGGGFQLNPAASWYLLAVDDCALPAAQTILESLSAGFPVYAFIEVADPSEEQPIATEAAAEVTWLHRRGGEYGAALRSAVAAAVLPEGAGAVWSGCEAALMRDLRRHLIQERGLAPATLHTQGYWKQGAQNHPDRDLGLDG